MSCEHGLKTKECYVCMSPKYGEQIEKQNPLDYSRGWKNGYEHAEMRFRNNFEEALRLVITSAVENAVAETFKSFRNDYKTGAEKMNEEKEQSKGVEWVGLIDVTICPKTMRPCEVTGCLGRENHPEESRSICSGIGITE